MPNVLITVFALTLTIELTLIFIAFRRADERAAAARLSLAVPGLAGASDAHGGAPRWRDASFIRLPASRLQERERREVLSALGRFKVPARHAELALTLAKLTGAALLAGLTLLVAHRLLDGGAFGWLRLPMALVGAACGWSIPMLLAHAEADRRAAAVVKGLPEALDLLVVCVEAGLSFEMGLERITVALKDVEPMLAEELALTAADLKVLGALDEGLANLARRIDLPEVRSVVTILSQSLRYGTPLAESLRSAAEQMRNEALIKLEERGNRLPTLLTLPMMLLIFPTIFLVFVGPAALNAMDALKR
jgi:tight adherence protein C